MNYVPKFLEAGEPFSVQDRADAQVEAIFRRKRETAMDEELSAMCKRNPNRLANADRVEAIPTEAPAARLDRTMLIVSGIMLMVTLAISLAQVLG